MATRTLEIDLRQGTGASSEPMYGVVTVQRAKAKSAGGFEILPFETSLKLINGKATITEAETDGTGPFYDSVYLFRVQNGYCAPRWGFMAALPDGSTPITTGELPMVDPITGEGIYMDAQEWNALYGTLPDRVSATETRLGVLDGQGQRGYTVDQTAGRTVTVWDYLNNREQLIYGDTGRRNITALFNGSAPNASVGIAGGNVYLTRVGRMVELNMENVTLPPGQSTSFVQLGDIIPVGFQPPNERDYPLSARLTAEGTNGGGIRINRLTGRIYIYLHANGETIRVTATWFTEDPWPTALPGVAV